MEEILASIRKIISEDTPEAAPAPQAPAAASPPPEAAKQEFFTQPEETADADIEVLELTQEVVDAAPSQPEPAPMPDKSDDIVFEPARSGASEEGIFSDHTRKAMDDAFASLDQHGESPAAPPKAAAPIPAVDGSSVESVFERAVRESFEPVLEKYLADNSPAVLDRMKPLIREWMDEHFPALLEGAVRNEIERVVRARGRH
jgi:cell pole-organizing protein PopZ